MHLQHFSTSIAAALAAFVSVASSETEYPASAAIEAARALAKTSSPVSSIKGKMFDRFVQIWLENEDYEIAAGDPSFQWIASQGLTLTNYKAIFRPSQPNYVAGVGGQRHGVWTDWKFSIDEKVKTIVDLLEPAGVSWSVYGEDMPYSGFQGDYVNQKTGADAYVRKHNPLMSYKSVTSNEDRLARCKNFTMFERELQTGMLPQWMFITPNMTNDGHDSSVTVAGSWAKSFLEPLLSNKNFMQKTLILLTFDETRKLWGKNRVFSVLLGDAVPGVLRGTKSSIALNHYSALSTVEYNWNLGNLGGGDVKAPLFFPRNFRLLWPS